MEDEGKIVEKKELEAVSVVIVKARAREGSEDGGEVDDGSDCMCVKAKRRGIRTKEWIIENIGGEGDWTSSGGKDFFPETVVAGCGNVDGGCKDGWRGLEVVGEGR